MNRPPRVMYSLAVGLIGVATASGCSTTGGGSPAATAAAIEGSPLQKEHQELVVAHGPVSRRVANSRGDRGRYICPVMPDMPVDLSGKYSVEHEGKRYLLCCGSCPEKFAADPATYVTTGPASDAIGNLKNESGEHICPVMPDMAADLSGKYSVEHEGTRYLLCCESCPDAFQKDPDRYVGTPGAG